MEDKPIFYIVKESSWGEWGAFAIFKETDKTFTGAQLDGYFTSTSRLNKPKNYVRAETKAEVFALRDDLNACQDKHRDKRKQAIDEYKADCAEIIDAFNAATGVK